MKGDNLRASGAQAPTLRAKRERVSSLRAAYTTPNEPRPMRRMSEKEARCAGVGETRKMRRAHVYSGECLNEARRESKTLSATAAPRSRCTSPASPSSYSKQRRARRACCRARSSGWLLARGVARALALPPPERLMPPRRLGTLRRSVQRELSLGALEQPCAVLVPVNPHTVDLEQTLADAHRTRLHCQAAGLDV